MEGKAVVGVDDPRHAGPAGGHPAERPGLGGMRVHHVEAALAEQVAQGPQGPPVTARVDRGAQRWLDDHLQASRGGVTQQVIPAAGDDRGPEAIRIERLRPA
jgi:hypothetical protein